MQAMLSTRVFIYLDGISCISPNVSLAEQQVGNQPALPIYEEHRRYKSRRTWLY